MRMSIKTHAALMFVIGAVVFALVLNLIVSSTISYSVTALSQPASGIQPLQEAADTYGWGILGIALGAGLAVGLAGIGAGLGMGTASAAALGAITEKPETFGKSILYVVFIEAIGIYGFVIAFLLSGYILQIVPGH